MRAGSTERGYDARWRKARATYLRRNPWCVGCSKAGVNRPATEVDHIVPHKRDQALFWDTQGNWQALCKACHSAKTAHKDGGFGRQASVKGCDVNGMPLDPMHLWNQSVA